MADRKCWIGECANSVVARELCSKHYQQWRKRFYVELRKCADDECTRPLVTRGLCDLHYRRERRVGNADLLPYKKLPGYRTEERFWAKVEKTSTCWIWVGAQVPEGYGQFRIDARRPQVAAHRFAYELLVGPIGEGLQIDHLCRNPSCVNPEHLEAVTVRENILRGTAPTAVQARKTHCVHGHAFDEKNTRIDRFGHRQCRACGRERQKAKYKRLRESGRPLSTSGWGE